MLPCLRHFQWWKMNIFKTLNGIAGNNVKAMEERHSAWPQEMKRTLEKREKILEPCMIKYHTNHHTHTCSQYLAWIQLSMTIYHHISPYFPYIQRILLLLPQIATVQCDPEPTIHSHWTGPSSLNWLRMTQPQAPGSMKPAAWRMREGGWRDDQNWKCAHYSLIANH